MISQERLESALLAGTSEIGWQFLPSGEVGLDLEDAKQHLGAVALSMSTDEKPEISTIQVRRDGRSPYLAETHLAMGFHTDNVYLERPCRYILLLCLESAEDGGVTMLADGPRVLGLAQEDMISELRKPQWLWKRPQKIGDGPTPPLAVTDEKGTIRWWKVGLKNKSSYLNTLADEFDGLIANDPGNVSLTLGKGDLLMVDNQRILHARTSFKGDDRKILRARIW